MNDSFAGREGKYVTSRNIRSASSESWFTVALRVEQGDSPDKFKVSAVASSTCPC